MADYCAKFFPDRHLTSVSRPYMANKHSSFGTWQHLWTGYAMSPEMRGWLQENARRNYRFQANTGEVQIWREDIALMFKMRFL